MAAVAAQFHKHMGSAHRRHDSSISSPPDASPHQRPLVSLNSNLQMQPTLREPRKAQKLLGLVTERPTSSRRNTLNYETPNSGIVKAQRTLGTVVDEPRDMKSWRIESEIASVCRGSLEEKLRQAEKDVRRLSGMASLADIDVDDGAEKSGGHTRLPSTSTRGWIDIALEEEDRCEKPPPEPSRLSPFPPQIELPSIPSLSPLFSHSPEPVELDATTSQHICRAATRSRQSSCASSRFHNRPTNKIASSRSRGLRANTCPNFSRHLSVIVITPIPGEDMERDPLHVRYPREPPTPSSPIKSPFAFDNVKQARAHVEEELKKAMEMGSIKPRMSCVQQRQQQQQQHPKKARWSSLPVSFIKLTNRYSRPENEGILIPDHGHGKENNGKGKSSKVSLTTENLQRWEEEAGYMPKMYRMGYDLMKSPVEIDMDVEKGSPDLRKTTPSNPEMRAAQTPNLQSLATTPPSSPPLAQSQSLFRRQRPSYPTPSSSERRNPPSPLLTPPLSHSHSHSHPSPSLTVATLATQKESTEFASTPLYICSLCKEAEHPSTFPTRKITERCLHPTRTCFECLKVWIGDCRVQRGWKVCTCPECGERMGEGDLRALGEGAVG